MQLKIVYRTKTIPTQQDIMKTGIKKSVYLDSLHWKSPIPIVLLPLSNNQVKYAIMGKVTKYGSGNSHYYIKVFIKHNCPNFKF
jgi:hypothetical protein